MAEETVAPVEDVGTSNAPDTAPDGADAQDGAPTPAPDDVAVAADGEASESPSVAVAVADAPPADAQASDMAPDIAADTASDTAAAQAPAPTSEADAEPTTTTTTLEAASAATPIEGVPLDGSIEPQVTVGRIVHVTLDRGVNTGECRPALVVRVWNNEVINAQLFTDGLNDHMDYASGMVWMTSLHYAKPVAGQPTPPLTWHWSWED